MPQVLSHSGNTAVQLTPTQQAALEDLVVVAKFRAAPLVELRSPPMLGRGHGVTTVLRAAAAALGVELLGISTALQKISGKISPSSPGDSQFPGLMDLEPVRVIREVAMRSLQEYGVVVIDDLDLAVCPRHLRRSRTLVGEIRGAGSMWNWDVGTQPTLLLKALCDAATAAGGCVVFAALEDSFLAFAQEPFSVTLGEPTEADYQSILLSRLGSEAAASLDVGALFTLHSQLSPADLVSSYARATIKSMREQKDLSAPEQIQLAKPKPSVNTASLLSSVRDALVNTSAVRPDDVETVDLEKYPGLDSIRKDLEKFVLFPIEQPELAAKLGLGPKRGVLIHGDPGTGKTTVGRWLAHRLKGKFFRVGEMMVHSDMIKVFAAAQAAAPSVVFIDDADIVIGGWRPIDGGRGSDIFRFLLGQMDGLTSRGERQQQNGDVIVILTGQNVQWMAKMLLRSGRIELWLKTKLPEPKIKRKILEKYVSEDPGAMQLLAKNGDVPDVRQASQAGDRYCGADLRRIVSDAKILAAWDRHGSSRGEPDQPLEGSEYLEKAAKAVTDMQNEVDSVTRALYG